MQLNLNTTFTPFTYEEMVAPLKDYTEAYKETEAAYSDLVTQTEAWKDIANREKSPEAYEMYRRYSGALNAIVDDFSTGMTASNRRALMRMKRDYAKEITPIAKASTALDEAQKFRQEKGPDAVFEVDNYNSLDSFLHGNKANNKYVLKSDIMKETAAITEAAMKEAAKDPEFKKVMGSQYWQITQHTGGSWADYEAAMKQAIGSDPILNNKFSEIKNKMLKKYGYDKFGIKGQQEIAGAIDLGMAIGLDKETTTFQGNQGFSVGGRGGGGGGGGRSYSRSGGGGGYYSKGKGKDSDEEEDEYTYSVNDGTYYVNRKGQVKELVKGSYNAQSGTRVSYWDLHPTQKEIVDKIIGDADVDDLILYKWQVSKDNQQAQSDARGQWAYRIVSGKKRRKWK